MTNDDDDDVQAYTDPDAQGRKLEPAVTLTEAARHLYRVDDGRWKRAARQTVRRRLEKGDLPNAWRADRADGQPGRWMVPVVDLDRLDGLMFRPQTAADEEATAHLGRDRTAAGPTVDSLPDRPVGASDGALGGQVVELSARVVELTERLAAADRRAEVAEAVAAERERALTRFDRAIRVLELEPGPVKETSPAVGSQPSGDPSADRPGFWKRLWKG